MIQEPNNIAQQQKIPKLYETQSLALKTTQNIIPIVIETNSTTPPRILLITRQQNNKTNNLFGATNIENNLKINSNCATCLRTAQTYEIQQNITNQPQAVSVPFLPTPENPMPFVKRNSHSGNGLVKNSNLKALLNEDTLCLEAQAVNTLTGTDYQQPLQMLNSNSNPLIQSVNSNNNIINIKSELNPNNKSNSSNMKPMTLTSMAGIQLTGADDMSLTGMSGAMSPTATVEEIDVPVFIDEYLQQSASKTSKKTTITITAEPTNIINNNNKNINTINNGTNNGNGICIEDGTYENFNFDFDLIAEELKNSIKEDLLRMDFEENRNNKNNNNCSSNNNNSSINNNNNNYDNTSYNLNNMNDNLNLFKMDDDDLIKSILKEETTYNSNKSDYSNSDYNFSNNTNNMPSYFQISPSVVDTEINFNSQDENFINSIDINMMANEDAIDISKVTNDELSFDEMFTSSQNNPMLCGEAVTAAIQNIIINAEPHLSNLEDNLYYTFKTNSKPKPIEQVNSIPLTDASDLKPPMSLVNLYEVTCNEYDIKTEYDNSLSKENSIVRTNEENAFVSTIPTTTPTTTTTPVSVNLKRLAPSTKDIMLEKRRKLCLDTSLHVELPVCEIKTPDVINLIAEMCNDDEHSMNNKNTIKILDVVDLLNASNSSFQSATDDFYGEAFVEGPSPTYVSSSKYSDTDDDSPYTPQSFTSYTCTAGYTTSPDSPSESLQQQSNNSNTNSNKKKRGRPSKEHSDRPDPEKLRWLPENERKRREDRAKNNEASRQSRLKNRLREEQEIKEEQGLMHRNDELISQLSKLNTVESKLKRAVQRNFNKHKC